MRYLVRYSYPARKLIRTLIRSNLWLWATNVNLPDNDDRLDETRDLCLPFWCYDYLSYTGSPLSRMSLLNRFRYSNTHHISGPHIISFFVAGLSACERKSFIFLRKELPVRLANIMKEIHLLPDHLLRMPSVGLVNNWYAMSFEEIIQFEKADINETTLDKWVHIMYMYMYVHV